MPSSVGTSHHPGEQLRMRTTTVLAAGVLGAALALAGQHVAEAVQPARASDAGITGVATPDVDYVPASDANLARVGHRTAVVRLGPKPYVHQNGSHGTLGIRALTITQDCDLTLWTDWQDGDKVLAATVDEDEVLSAKGVEAGISGGGGWASIKLGRGGKRICYDDPVFKSGATVNVWVDILYLRAPAAESDGGDDS
ncbi:hypothetical protein [Angustibacter peucedani]